MSKALGKSGSVSSRNIVASRKKASWSSKQKTGALVVGVLAIVGVSSGVYLLTQSPEIDASTCMNESVGVGVQGDCVTYAQSMLNGLAVASNGELVGVASPLTEGSVYDTNMQSKVQQFQGVINKEFESEVLEVNGEIDMDTWQLMCNKVEEKIMLTDAVSDENVELIRQGAVNASLAAGCGDDTFGEE